MDGPGITSSRFWSGMRAGLHARSAIDMQPCVQLCLVRIVRVAQPCRPRAHFSSEKAEVDAVRGEELRRLGREVVIQNVIPGKSVFKPTSRRFLGDVAAGRVELVGHCHEPNLSPRRPNPAARSLQPGTSGGLDQPPIRGSASGIPRDSGSMRSVLDRIRCLAISSRMRHWYSISRLMGSSFAIGGRLLSRPTLEAGEVASVASGWSRRMRRESRRGGG